MRHAVVLPYGEVKRFIDLKRGEKFWIGSDDPYDRGFKSYLIYRARTDGFLKDGGIASIDCDPCGIKGRTDNFVRTLKKVKQIKDCRWQGKLTPTDILTLSANGAAMTEVTRNKAINAKRVGAGNPYWTYFFVEPGSALDQYLQDFNHK